MTYSFSDGQTVIIHTSYFHMDGEHYFGIYGQATMCEMHIGNSTPMIRMVGNINGENLMIYISTATISGITSVKEFNNITSSKILKLQNE
jgi:hypothetical protein